LGGNTARARGRAGAMRQTHANFSRKKNEVRKNPSDGTMLAPSPAVGGASSE